MVRPRSPQVPNQKGFTLVPIIIILVLLIIVGIAAFAFGILKLPDNQKSDSASTELKINSPLKDYYENPFRTQKENDSSYTNPFENLE